MHPSLARRARALRRAAGRLVASAQVAAGCAVVDDWPLADLPPARGAAAQALLVVHERDCDSNLAAFGVFERPDVQRALPLVGVVALERDADDARIRRSLAAFDLPAPLLAVSDATRDSLRSTTRNWGMTIVVVKHRRAIRAITLPLGAGSDERFTRSVRALADSLAESSR